MFNLDQEYLEILARLEEGANVRRKILAAEIGEKGLSEPTLSKRISSLEAGKYIKKFTIDIDYALLGYRTNAITLMKMEHQSDETIDQVFEVLLNNNNAIEFATALGEWDIYIKWMFRGPDEIAHAVRELLAIAPMEVETITLGEFSGKERGVKLFDLKKKEGDKPLL